jgi:hypothetical protein
MALCEIDCFCYVRDLVKIPMGAVGRRAAALTVAARSAYREIQSSNPLPIWDTAQ